jgi:glycerol-3-phosphate dehydrogenase
VAWSDERWDAVVTGGGVYGILLALEGAARGQRVLLVERDAFGAATSANHLRTIHGGLRYLQFLDLPRAIISNRQRLWWLRNFPDLVQPIACLMPLYDVGLRRPAAFRAAFALARALGLHRDGQGRAGDMGVLTATEVERVLPLCRRDGLTGGALWQDAFMPRAERLVDALVAWAQHAGVVLRGRTCLVAAMREGNEGWRLELGEADTGATISVCTRYLVNASGPWIDEVAQRVIGRPVEPMLIPTLAWGLAIDRPPVARCSVAVAPPGKGMRTYFAHALEGKLLIGTGHAGIPPGGNARPHVDDSQVDSMLVEVNDALPGLGVRRDEVGKVFRGILPGVRRGSDALLMRPRIVDHGRRDGATGAWSVLGVKFTEAPFVARGFWSRVLPSAKRALPARPDRVGSGTSAGNPRVSSGERDCG